jgi:hypothetical protein
VENNDISHRLIYIERLSIEYWRIEITNILLCTKTLNHSHKQFTPPDFLLLHLSLHPEDCLKRIDLKNNISRRAEKLLRFISERGYSYEIRGEKKDEMQKRIIGNSLKNSRKPLTRTDWSLSIWLLLSFPSSRQTHLCRAHELKMKRGGEGTNLADGCGSRNRARYDKDVVVVLADLEKEAEAAPREEARRVDRGTLVRRWCSGRRAGGGRWRVEEERRRDWNWKGARRRRWTINRGPKGMGRRRKLKKGRR